MYAEKLAQVGLVLEFVVHGCGVEESAFSLLDDCVTDLLWLNNGITEYIPNIAPSRPTTTFRIGAAILAIIVVSSALLTTASILTLATSCLIVLLGYGTSVSGARFRLFFAGATTTRSGCALLFFGTSLTLRSGLFS